MIAAMFLTACGARPAPTAPDAVADPGFLAQYAATYRFRLGRPNAVTVAPDGSAVYFLRSGARDFEQVMFRVDGKTGKTEQFLDAQQLLGGDEGELSPEEKARRERLRLSARGIARFELVDDGQRLLIPLGGDWFIVDVATRKASRVTNGTEAYLAPGGAKLALVRDGDLYAIDVATGSETRLTTRANDQISHGQAEFVAQEEMSRYAGAWWGPKGKRLLYQKTDTTGMERFHLGDPLDPAAAPHPWPYPRPGKKNAAVQLFLRTLSADAPIEVQWDRAAFPYVSTVRWPENAPLTVVVTNRLQTELKILAVNPADGTTRTLHAESDAAWINLDQDAPHWLADGKGFLWSTERDGQWQLELRRADGTLERGVTSKADAYRGLITVDEARGFVWFASGAVRDGVARVSLRSDGPRVDGPMDDGDVSLVGSDNGTLGVLAHRPANGHATWAVVPLGDAGMGKPVAAIESNAEHAGFDAEPDWQTVEIEGRTHHAVILRPRNFDASKRYPVVLSVYGGPGVQIISQHAPAYLFNQWLADHGFIVVMSDGRGTPGRGRAWERVIKNDLITIPLNDQIAVLQALAERSPGFDLERVGVYGWSFGGYFSAMAVMQRPDVFKVGVAGAPVTDWRDYDTHYTERFLGLPDGEAGAAVYDKSSVLTYAPKLERPLLLIHGTDDDNVYFVHALKMSNALFRAGIAHDFLPLSGFTHMVSDVNVAQALYGRIIGMFLAHLGTPE